MSLLQLPMLGTDPLSPFPPTSQALRQPNGLLAWGGSLEPQRLLAAYRLGVFPWYSEGEPILWWSPAPRCVLIPSDVHLSRRTRRRFNSERFLLTADTAFTDVIKGCAAPRTGQTGTWLTRDMQRAYSRLHQEGIAHSVEVWNGTELAGGIYGLAVGRMFFAESMFSRRQDASKIALVALCRQLEAWGFGLLDCPIGNPHLTSMGAVLVSRLKFERQLRQLVQEPGKPGSWSDRFTCSPRW